MALSATIYKTHLSISDLRRHHYQDYSLTLALHPSETEQRMMIRLLCFCLYASEQLEFSRGLSNDDEPDLWQKSLTGDTELWIELGQPDEKRVRKACGRASQVVIAGFQQRPADIWWQQHEHALTRFNNLSVIQLQPADEAILAAMVQRNMKLQVTLDEGQMWLTDEQHDLEVSWQVRR